MNRFGAGLVHLAISVAVAGLVFLAVRFLWYPGVLFDVAGGRDLFLLVVGVDVVMGPLITLIVYRRGKKSLRSDLATIAVLQLAALSYGLWSVALSRPVYLVFVKDRFELTRASDIEPEDLAMARGTPYESLSWTGPRYIGVRFPTDRKESFDLMMSAAAGKDIHTYPRYFAPYSVTAAQVAQRSAAFAQLRSLNPARAREVDAVAASIGRPESRLRFLPLKTGKGDLAVIVDGSDGAVLRLAGLRPWEY